MDSTASDWRERPRQPPTRWLAPLLLALTALASLHTLPASAQATGRSGAAIEAAAAPADADRLATLGPGDSVTIQVYGQPDMTTTVYISNDGTIRVPLAGAVQVGGTTPIQAAQRIQQALKAGRYFVNPIVTVTLVQTRTSRVAVLGEVRQPGTYPIDPSTTVFALLAQAGGETANAADVVYVRRHQADGRVASYPVNLQSLRNSAASGLENPSQSQTLQGGDELFVPQAEHFYIYGEVTTPNLYKLEPGMTVIQAVARAGGITPRGSGRRIEIKRLGKNGTYVISRATPDELVQPDDVIRVKESIF